MTNEEMRTMIKTTVRETLVQLGVDATDPIEAQRDFQFLRDWRTTTESVRGKAIFTAVGLIVVGLIGVIWLGIKSVIR